MKTCSKCKTEKPRSEFSKHRQKKDGLSYWCKACDGIKSKSYAMAHPDKNDPEKDKAWRAANPERCRELRKAWHLANPDASRIHSQNRRARILKNGGKLSNGLADKLFKLQRGKCACCHASIDDENHLDHRIPVALGGPNEDWNMQLLCPLCNMQKGAKHPVDFMQQRGFLL